MLSYPGGTELEASTVGYSFTRNFFSDLGRTRAINGHLNLASCGLFITAMCIGAASLILFFLAFAESLAGKRRAHQLSRLATVLGFFTAICFTGVAATPVNRMLHPHVIFVNWAFRMFLAAVVINLIAAIITPELPRRISVVFAIFAVLLVGFVLLLSFGKYSSEAWMMVQTIGQKIIVYSAILTVLIGSMFMRTHLVTPRMNKVPASAT